MSKRIECWNPNCQTHTREILHSAILQELRCVTCAKGSSAYKCITCKSCSKKHFDTFGKVHDFYFKAIRAPTSMEFYCSDCAKIVREKEPLCLLVNKKKCQSSLHQSKDDDKRIAQSSVDGKFRCLVCENQFLKIELREKERALREKPKVTCQSASHRKTNDDKTVAPSKQDGKNRCVVCELKYTQILLENEKLKRHT